MDRTRPTSLARQTVYVLQGWPSTVRDAELQPYYCRRDELSVDAGCVLWGSRLIVPSQGREEVMNVLHDSHPGIVRMKGIARSPIWWPKIDAALEERVRSCHVCQTHQKVSAPAPLHPWEWPSEIAFFHRWEFIENLLKFNPIRELKYKVNWEILA